MCYLRYIKMNPLICLVFLILLVISTVRCTSQDKAQSRLEKARTDLRISQNKEQQVSKELEKLKESGKATPETLKDYETYLDHVQSLVNENQKVVQEMEAAYSRRRESAKTHGLSSSVQSESVLDAELPEEEELDEVTALDRRLNDSLSEFDEMLLKEMGEIRARSANRIRELTEEAAAAAKRLEDKGVDVSSSAEETSSDEQAKKASSEREREEGMSDEKVTASESRDDRSRSGEKTTYGKQAEPPRDSDQDDIVARQLREAAEQETDPELKKKLWKEYEDYKKGRR